MASDIPAAELAEAVLPDGPMLVGEGGERQISSGYRTYILVVMTLVYVVNYLDRQILGILVPQIKAEFHLSDSQIGILTGPAFAVIYATLGIPLAVLADRINRRNIIAASLATFSLMTLLCGYAVQFWQLLLARFGTGIGEAGTSPSINSVLADLYPPQRRAAALSFYTAGLNVGLLVAFFGGGWIVQHFGWRTAFLTAGVPGFLLAVLILLTIREPRRGLVEQLADRAAAPSMWTVARVLWSQRAFRWMAIGTSFSSFGGYAGIYFIPLFLATTHHLTPTQYSTVLAVLTGIFGAAGTYLAGVFADRFGKRDLRANMYVPIAATFLAIPAVPVVFLSNSTPIALTALVLPALTGAAYVGPAYAMAQGLVPLRMRARAVAILLFILNIIGLGLGPPTIGVLSDLLRPRLGTDALRYAMLATILTGLAGAFCYWRASRTLRADLARGPGLA